MYRESPAYFRMCMYMCMCVAKEVSLSSNSIRFYNILSAAYATGEYNKVTNGMLLLLLLMFILAHRTF